ncbi:hypothetical protein KK062_30280, partial [Fulvivirgaceae bacterium PWU5]
LCLRDRGLFPEAYEADKWAQAVDACREAIQTCEEQGLRLYTYIQPANISNLPESLRQVLTIQNAVTERWVLNPELIWALNPTFDHQGYATPRMTSKAAVNIFSN